MAGMMEVIFSSNMENAVMFFWLVLVVIFLVAELMTVGLTSIWFAAGALVALFAAMLEQSVGVQLALFVLVSLILLISTRPFARRYINSRVQKTNAETAIGQIIHIKERVDNVHETGKADFNGLEWTVRAETDRDILEVGDAAKVTRISGVKLMVEPVKE